MTLNPRRATIRVSRRRKAALLLEVVVAFAIVTAALGLLGGQLSGGLRMVGYAELQTRAGELADRILALLELDQTLQQQIFVDNKTDGDFGTAYPGWFWRILVQPTQTEGLGMVTVQVLFDEDRGSDVARGKVMRELHLLKADPGRINLETDFGFTQDQVSQLTEQIQIPGFDPNQLDPQALVSMPPEQLLLMLGQLLPLLQQLAANAGINPGQIPQTPQDAADFLNNLQNGGIPGVGGSGGNKDSAGGDLAPDAGSGGSSGGGRSGGATIDDLLRLRDGGGGSPNSGVNGRSGQIGQPRGNGNNGATGNTGGNRGGATPAVRPGGGNGGSGAAVGPNRIGSGNRAGAAGSSGGGSTGNNTGANNAGGNRGGTNRAGAGNRGAGGSSGGGSSGSGGGSGQQHYTIEDLMRLRDGQPINR